MSKTIQVDVSPNLNRILKTVTQIRRDAAGAPISQKANAAYLMEVGARALAQEADWLEQVRTHEEQRRATLAGIGFTPSTPDSPIPPLDLGSPD